jgi:hypothetical protein
MGAGKEGQTSRGVARSGVFAKTTYTDRVKWLKIKGPDGHPGLDIAS